jgi:hypothetical protein
MHVKDGLMAKYLVITSKQNDKTVNTLGVGGVLVELHAGPGIT